MSVNLYNSDLIAFAKVGINLCRLTSAKEIYHGNGDMLPHSFLVRRGARSALSLQHLHSHIDSLCSLWNCGDIEG